MERTHKNSVKIKFPKIYVYYIKQDLIQVKEPCLCYSCIHSYLNYANTAWCSTNRTYPKKLQSQQKHAIRIILHEIKFAHTREHFKGNNILNINQLNIFNNLFLQKWKYAQWLLSNFLRFSYHYPTSFSQNDYLVPSFKLTKSNYRIIIRTPKLWKIILNIEEKLIEKPLILKATIKTSYCRQRTSSYIFDAYIKLFNKNFLNKKLEIISERFTRNLMIRPARSSARSFPVSSLILPSSKETFVYIISCLFFQSCNLGKK